MFEVARKRTHVCERKDTNEMSRKIMIVYDREVLKEDSNVRIGNKFIGTKEAAGLQF